jgi:hypothetical protein
MGCAAYSRLQGIRENTVSYMQNFPIHCLFLVTCWLFYLTSKIIPAQFSTTKDCHVLSLVSEDSLLIEIGFHQL